jgi:hypothetical protein
MAKIKIQSPISNLDKSSGAKKTNRQQAEEFVLRVHGVHLKSNSPETYEAKVKETMAQFDANVKQSKPWA